MLDLYMKMNTESKQIRFDRIVAKHGPSTVTSTILRLGLFRKKVAGWKEIYRLRAVLTAEYRAVAQNVTTPRSAIAKRVATPQAFTPSAITPVGTPVAKTPTIVPFPWSQPMEFLVSTPNCDIRPVVGNVLDANRLSMQTHVPKQVLKYTTPTASPTASPKAKRVAHSPVSSISKSSPSSTWAQLSPLCKLPSTPKIRVRVDERLRFPPDSPRVPD
jgi:hypothetical protein